MNSYDIDVDNKKITQDVADNIQLDMLGAKLDSNSSLVESDSTRKNKTLNSGYFTGYNRTIVNSINYTYGVANSNVQATTDLSNKINNSVGDINDANINEKFTSIKEATSSENLIGAVDYIIKNGSGGEGTTVIANPETTGTEETLNALTVGSTTYLTPKYDLAPYAKTEDLATVATSGKYEDLSDTPDLTNFVEKEEGKGLSTVDFTDTSYVHTDNNYTEEEKTKLAGIEEGATKVIVDEAFSSTSANPVQNKVIATAMGTANGFATLDANGKLVTSQLPTSARQIVGQLDAENTHTLPDASGYNAGDEILVINSGYYTQSTAFTLEAGNTLTEMEAYQANLLIANSYVFTLTSGETSLGTVKLFETNKVTFNDDTSIDLPYSADLSATSEPSVVQVSVVVGDEIINIDSHWIHLSNTSNVTSVNSKTGAVVLAASDVGAIGTSDILTSFEETTSDEKVVSEKLIKDSLDSKLNTKNPVGTGTFSLNRHPDDTAGNYSISAGYNCCSTGDCSHAEGENTQADGRTAHAEGGSTKANKDYSHAEGYMTTADGDFSHAEGVSTKTSAYASHAEGRGTIAIGNYQHVQGKYNETSSIYANIVGGGSDDQDRFNIYTLDWSGNGIFRGDVTATDTSGNKSSLLNKINKSDIVTSWDDTTVDTKIPSEKLVKDCLDTKANSADLPIKEITIYVDQENGSDDNDGLTESTPIKELTAIASKIESYKTKSLKVCIMSDITYDTLIDITFTYVENIKIYAYGCDSAYTKDFSKNKKLTNIKIENSYSSIFSLYNIDMSVLSGSNNLAITSSGVNFNKCRFSFDGTKTTESFVQFLRCPAVFMRNCEFNNFYAAMLLLTSSVCVKDTTFTDCDEFSCTRGSIIYNVPSSNISMVTNGINTESSACYIDDGTCYINGVKSVTSDDLPQTELYVYVDQVNGSDDNDGLTESTPIKELTTITKKYNLSKYYKLFIYIMSDITYDTFTNISISGVNSINICPSDCTSIYTTDYSKNKKLTNIRFGISMCRTSIHNIDFESSLYSGSNNPLTTYDLWFARIIMCRFTYTGTSYSSARGVSVQSSRALIEDCIFTGFKNALHIIDHSDIALYSNTFDETSCLYEADSSVIRNLGTDYLYLLTNGSSIQSSIIYLSDGTMYIDGALFNPSIVTSWESTTSDTKIPSEKLVKSSLDLKADASTISGYSGETWTFTLEDGSTVTKTIFCK